MSKSEFHNSCEKDELTEVQANLLGKEKTVIKLESPPKRQSSLVVIFSAWNTMIGSAVTTLPWAYQQSGLALGILLSLVSCLISYYTCMLTIRMTGNDSDYAVTMRRFYGKFN